MPNQDIIKADVERVQSGSLSEREKSLLENFLTKYCKEQAISYKQCMNEICAPFVLMTREGVPEEVCYKFFTAFIEINLTTMFADQEFRPLQAFFLVFRIVLRYHEPRLSAFFQMNKITPELYTTSWFLTAFGFKIDDLSLLYKLWYELLVEKDQLMLIYLSIAFLQHFRSDIINKEDSLIAHAITQISISNLEDLQEIISSARKIKQNTPYSIRIRLLQYNLFNLSTIDSSLERLERDYCLILPTQEALRKAYPNEKICDCIHVRCIWCSKHEKREEIILIDCRTKNEQSNGIMPNTVLLPDGCYKNSQKVLEFPDQFLEVRGSVHFSLIGSTEFQTSSFDIKHGTENGGDSEVHRMIETLLQAFLIKGFPYLSVVEGGYQQCHQFVEYYGLELLNHGKKCKICDNGRLSYSHAMISKLKDMKFSYIERFSNVIEEKKRSRSTDQDKGHTEVTVNSMLKNRKTEGFKCRIYEKKKGTVSDEKFVVMFNNTLFAYGKACPKEKFPVSLIFFAKLETLLKITSLREQPSVLSFVFPGQSVMIFKFKTNEIARLIISQIKKYYVELKAGNKN